MFTRCPNCRKVQSISLEQLRNNRAIAFCSNCATQFDALELLTETGDETTDLTPLPWEKSHSTSNTGWSVGAFTALLVLIGQIVYFEGYGLTQQVKFRPVLEKFCQYLNCQIPPYQQLDEISVLNGSFTSLPNHNYAFNAVISNQGRFGQNYPNLRLTLQNYGGQAFTYRVFKPEEYLFGTITDQQMASGTTISVNLEIAATQTPIGGYTFDLTY